MEEKLVEILTLLQQAGPPLWKSLIIHQYIQASIGTLSFVAFTMIFIGFFAAFIRKFPGDKEADLGWSLIVIISFIVASAAACIFFFRSIPQWINPEYYAFKFLMENWI